jgi:hypothetical protein
MRFLVATVLAAFGGAQAIQLKGTVTLAQVNVTKQCKFSGGATTLVALCQQSGIYAGKPGPAGAAYSWRWDLQIGKDGKTTGNATEIGELALNFGQLGLLRVTTKGRQVPIGKPTTNAARGRTTGTWKFKSGTKSLKGRSGSGTYVFETSRAGPNTFQIARITLTGSLS